MLHQVMSARARRLHRYAYEDYLRLEADSPVRHEFLDGEIFAMAGGTPEHAALAMAVGAALSAAVQGGPCLVFSSDLRVRVRATGLVTYPDVTVICGPTERDPEGNTTVLNPTVLVEVTSAGTEEFDRTEKLASYLLIPSLRAYLIVSHRRPQIESWQRDADGAWRTSSTGLGESLRIDALGCTLSMATLYGRVLDGV
jgi:Uma2 family endonuclease